MKAAPFPINNRPTRLSTTAWSGGNNGTQPLKSRGPLMGINVRHGLLQLLQAVGASLLQQLLCLGREGIKQLVGGAVSIQKIGEIGIHKEHLRP